MQRVACYVALRRATSHFDPPQRATRKGRSAAALALFGLIADAVSGLRFSVSLSKNAVRRLSLASTDDVSPELATRTNGARTRVAVTGATRKTGRLVVEELRRRDGAVVGLIRNATKAVALFGESGALEDEKGE